MVLCNSQREEGLVPSQICRTSNLVIPQNYKINLEPIFNFLRLFYWIIVEKTSMSRSTEKTFFTSAQVAQKLFFIMLLLDKLARSCTLGNAQNERAAIIERWCSKGIGDVAPTSGFAKIVNLYRFTLLANLWRGKIRLQFISNLGIIPLCHLWPIRPQAEILFFHIWTCAQLGYKWN